MCGNCSTDQRPGNDRSSSAYTVINSKLIVAYWCHMAPEILVNIGSGNGLLPDGTKPLPEPMLTYHQ